jgi:hypothetical protein
LDKTEVLWIGPNRHKLPGTLPVKWIKNSFQTLGLLFTLDETEMASLNLSNKVQNLKKTLNLWKMRNLTLIGRILVVKSLALSQITYIVTNVHIPAQYISEIEVIISNFVWKNSTPRVKFDVISLQIENGGLKYPNLLNHIKALKLAFIRRLFDEENKPWKQSFQSFFKNINVKDVFLSRGNLPESLLMNLPLFYKDLIQFWSELKKNIEPENA